MKISAWPLLERPREKLKKYGAANLSDAELLAILFRTGSRGVSALDLSRKLLSEFDGVRGVFNADSHALTEFNGVGVTKYIQLQASLELIRRYFDEDLKQRKILNHYPRVKQFLLRQLRDKQDEMFAVLWLDIRYCLLCYEVLFEGTIESAAVYPRTLVKKAIKHNAARVILVHNHPSGDPAPSVCDQQMTTAIQQALSAVEVEVIDHIVVGDGETFSFAEQGLLRAI